MLLNQRLIYIYIQKNLFHQKKIEINQCFFNNQIDTAENVSNIIKFFSKEIKLLSQEYQNELIIDEDEYFAKTMSIIIKNEFHKTSLNEYAASLLIIMMSKNKFVYNYKINI